MKNFENNVQCIKLLSLVTITLKTLFLFLFCFLFCGFYDEKPPDKGWFGEEQLISAEA